VNESGQPQDISLCSFSLNGARLFIAESTLVQPGDTFYLTSREDLLEIQLPGRQIFGNLAAGVSEGDILVFHAPSWQELTSWAVGPCQSIPGNRGPVLSEICCQSPGGDWIELYNPSGAGMDLSGCYLLDGENHYSAFPAGTSLGPGAFLAVCSDQELFWSENPGVTCFVECLDFGLNRDSDGITLVDNTGSEVLRVEWSTMEMWPMEEGCVMLLQWPTSPMHDPGSWRSDPLPGTPGAPNPGWPLSGWLSVMEPVYPNPTHGDLSFEYMVQVLPAEVLLYDISGRLVQDFGLLTSTQGTFSAELTEDLEPGLYFAVVQSRNSMTTGKVVLLP
jgi:hypothetical protein